MALVIKTVTIERAGGRIIAQYENVPERLQEFIIHDICSGYLNPSKRSVGLLLTRDVFIVWNNFLFDVADMCVGDSTEHSVVITGVTFKVSITTQELH